jgi:hypothetical protein
VFIEDFSFGVEAVQVTANSKISFGFLEGCFRTVYFLLVAIGILIHLSLIDVLYGSEKRR